MVLLVCLTFVGQAVASTVMSYQMMSMMSMMGMNGQEQSQNMSMMDHSNHEMASGSSTNSPEKSETSMEECCTETCNCFTGGCSNIAMFMKIVSNTAIVSSPTKILSYSLLAQSQQPTSLYRPPILS